MSAKQLLPGSSSFNKNPAASENIPERRNCISVSRLFKSYGELSVLSDLSFSVEDEEICCLMGPSGSGKTTLFRILMGLETADSGEISVPARLGAVFQENRLIGHLSPIENVRLVMAPGLKAEQRKQIASVLCEILPPECLDRPAHTLSGGMKRRLAAARALLSDCDALIMDEPFSGLDLDTRHQVIHFIRKHRNSRPLLLSTHASEDASLLHARILSLQRMQPSGESGTGPV